MKVAFVGHRKVEKADTLKERIMKAVKALIVEENADTFLFGSKSEFDELCYEVVTELKERYPHIKRVFVRAEYEYISDSYTQYLLTLYEDTFYPEQAHGAGVLSYIKRNQVMIDMCETLVAFCNKNFTPPTKTKSGTKIAVDYARKKGKRVINLFE